MKIHPLIRALGAMVPGARFLITSSHDWCSMTFSGQQLTIECDIAASNFDRYSGYLANTLPDHEFSIPNMLVADIAVVGQENASGTIKLLIEALVINA